MNLKIKILDSNREKTCCKLVLSGPKDSRNIQSLYCDGEYNFDVDSGQYHIDVYKGKLYWPHQEVIQMIHHDIMLEITLDEMIDPIDYNLYSFDAHSHTSRDDKLETGNPFNASVIMRGEGFHFLFAGSPYDHDGHLQYLTKNVTDICSYRKRFDSVIKEVNSNRFILDIGNELIKCRYGHICMMNFEQTPPYSKYYDESFDPWLFTKIGPEPEYIIPYIYEAIKNERDENSITFSAHPTSWWWHSNGEFITNIATTLGFEILAGTIDAMVIMGYRSDHTHYQQLWYDALNNGYFLPGIAETDIAFDGVTEDKIQFKTYAYLDEFSINDLCDAIRKGRCMVSSGPLLLMKVNGQLPGTVYNYSENDDFLVDIKAFRCYQGRLAKIELIINGDILKEYCLHTDSCEFQELIKIEKDGFIIAKCYDSAGNIAIANPVYFRNKPFVNHLYQSSVNVKVTKNGTSTSGFYWTDESPSKIHFDDMLSLKMKLVSNLNIEVEGQVKIIKLFELKELQNIFKYLYMGSFNADRLYNPGEIPSCEFKLDKIREILDNVNLEVNY